MGDRLCQGVEICRSIISALACSIRLSFRIDRSNGLHIVECPLSADQQVVVLEDGYEITATVVDTDVLDRGLTGFGDGVSEIKRTITKNF